jgi:hypothetical protein
MSKNFQQVVNTIACPDPGCQEGTIVVHNAYASDPLKGEEQPCDTCSGRGFIILSSRVVATD